MSIVKISKDKPSGVFREEIKTLTDKVLKELKRIYNEKKTEEEKQLITRDLFIIMKLDFTYVTGSYSCKSLISAPSCFLDMHKQIETSINGDNNKTNSLLFDGIYNISKSIFILYNLKRKLENNFSLQFDFYHKNLFSREEDLIEIEKKLKFNKLKIELNKLKVGSLSCMIQGITSVLTYLWRELNLNDIKNDQSKNLSTISEVTKTFSEKIFKDSSVFSIQDISLSFYELKQKVFVKNKKKFKLNELIIILLDFHELLFLFVCITRERLRKKFDRQFEQQEMFPTIVDLVIFNVIDLLKLQLHRDIKSVSNLNICKLYSKICYTGPLQVILFFTFVYFSNNFDPLDNIFAKNGILLFISEQVKNLEGYIFRDNKKLNYLHYQNNLWHKSIVKRPLYFTYVQFIKLNNKLKRLANIYSKSDASNCNFKEFDENLNTKERFVEFFNYFKASSGIIFQKAMNHEYDQKKDIYKIKKKLQNSGENSRSDANLLLLEKESFKEQYQNQKENIFFDIFQELVQFYELIVVYTHKEITQAEWIIEGKIKERPVFDPFCQESFQMIRDISILIYKSAFFITQYVLEKFKLLSDINQEIVFFGRDEKEVKKALIYSSFLIKKMIENFGINDRVQIDVETFLHADLKEIFFNHTLLVLELFTCKTNLDLSVHKELKLMLYIMLKFIKILPSINSYFIFYQSNADLYFEKTCSLYSIFTIEYGEQVLEFRKKKK